jgi:alcohol dehydrogenase, propanol-preferring
MYAMRLFSSALVETKPLKFVETKKPEPKGDQVLIRVLTCGVCHTDLHILEGEIHPPELPVTPGHQVVGVVEQITENSNNLKIGDRVGVPWLAQACGHCSACLRGEENLCEQARFTGFDMDGGFAEYLVADSRFCLPIPDGMDSLQAAPLLCAGIIGFRSLMKAGVKPGESVGLVGFGASAHLALQVAQSWGCSVYVFTRSEKHRLHALELGAVWAGASDERPPQALDRAVLFAPVGDLVPETLKVLRPGGTLAINAIYLSQIPPMDYALLYQERTLVSVTNATRQDGINFLNLAAKQKLHSTIEVYNLESANQALDDLKHSRFNGEAVLKIE